jgi:hypothetical protein
MDYMHELCCFPKQHGPQELNIFDLVLDSGQVGTSKATGMH